MSTKTKDENDLLREGKLPADPEANVRPIRPDVKVDRGDQREPSDVVAERALLGSLLWCAANAPELVALTTIRDLVDDAEQFYDARNRAIAGAMFKNAAEGKPIDAVTVHGALLHDRSDRVAGGMEYLEQLVAEAETASAQKARAWAELIREAYARRRLIRSAREIEKHAREGQMRASEVVDRGNKLLADDAAKIGGDAAVVPLGTAAAHVIRMAATKHGPYVPTGVRDLDAIIGGLFMRDVTLVAAGTSVGKSVLAMQIVRNIARPDSKVAALYATLETSAEDFARRVMCSLANVDLQKFRMCALNPLELQRITTAYRELHNAPIDFVDGPGQSILDIDAKAARAAQKHTAEGRKLALIVVDTMGLVKASADARKNGVEAQIAETSKGLRYLARKHECHVMALHHINRDGAKREGKSRLPKVTDLRGSGATENDADNVVLLHRDKDHKGLFVRDAPAACIVGKARNGKTGIALLSPEVEHGRFGDWNGDDGYFDH